MRFSMVVSGLVGKRKLPSVVEASGFDVRVGASVELDELDHSVRPLLMATLSHLQALTLGAISSGGDAVDAEEVVSGFHGSL